jgi:hypothetical protein
VSGCGTLFGELEAEVEQSGPPFSGLSSLKQMMRAPGAGVQIRDIVRKMQGRININMRWKLNLKDIPN